MSTILAAIDASAAAQPVVDTAVALGRVLQLPVVGFHVRQDTVASEQQLAARAAVELRPPVRAGPAGSTALAVATRVTKLVVVVPPEPRDPPPAGLQRVLVPLDGTATTASAVEQVTRWFAGSDVGIVSLHVFDDATVPSFWDRPEHDHAARSREFLARTPPASGTRLEVRCGWPSDRILEVAAIERADMISFGGAAGSPRPRRRGPRRAGP